MATDYSAHDPQVGDTGYPAKISSLIAAIETDMDARLLVSNNLSELTATKVTVQQNLDLEPGVDILAYNAALASLGAAGVAVANKVPILGGNKNIDELRIDTTFKLGATTVTATAAELNYLNTSSPGTSVINKALVLGANKNTDELRIDTTFKLGATTVTATATELNYTDGVVESIQNQLDYPNRNFINNGCFRVWQEATNYTDTLPTSGGNNTGSYIADGWALISDGNDIADVSKETTIIPSTGYASCKMLSATSSKKFGILYTLEAQDSALLKGKTVTLSFEARLSAGASNLSNISANILSWTSTADAPDKAPVSLWGTDLSSLTFATNWTPQAAQTNTALSNTVWTTVTRTCTIGTMNNLAVFIYINDVAATVGESVYITNVQLYEGNSTTKKIPFVSMQELIAYCQRYYEKSYDLTTNPGTITTNGCERDVIETTAVVSHGVNVRFKQSKFKIPTVTSYGPAAVTANLIDINGTGVSADRVNIGLNGCTIRKTTATAGVVDAEVEAHWVADARL